MSRIALVCSLAPVLLWTGAALGAPAPADELQLFKAWLERARPGYGCDEGPARFRNPTVEAAYPGLRFYYVLTYTRGIRPPFEHATSLVAQVDDEGRVRPLLASTLDGYRVGLIRVSSARDARRAAAAVLILASGDPGERRWKFRADLIRARKNRKTWVCTYRHGDVHHVSEVQFDRQGLLSAIHSNPPPVP